MREEFDHCPPRNTRAGYGLDTGLALSEPEHVVANELPQLLVTTDLARARVVDDHVTWPSVLQDAGVTFVQRGEVLRDWINPTLDASLPARQLYPTDEIRKPWHIHPCFVASTGQSL